MAKVKVTRNFQVTLPEEVRKQLEIEMGDYVEILPVDKQRALVRKIIPIEKLEGVWDEEMDAVMEEVRSLWRKWKL
jgi:AbrB family looped-hinge helix DNA binding protein